MKCLYINAILSQVNGVPVVDFDTRYKGLIPPRMRPIADNLKDAANEFLRLYHTAGYTL